MSLYRMVSSHSALYFTLVDLFIRIPTPLLYEAIDKSLYQFASLILLKHMYIYAMNQWLIQKVMWWLRFLTDNVSITFILVIYKNRCSLKMCFTLLWILNYISTCLYLFKSSQKDKSLSHLSPQPWPIEKPISSNAPWRCSSGALGWIVVDSSSMSSSESMAVCSCLT